jgi:YD repeat-containing protein
MKTLIASTAALALAALPVGAAITLTGNSYSEANTGLIPQSGDPKPEEKVDNPKVYPSHWRNFYYDANGDLKFESGTGDTYGNDDATLALNITITTTTVLNFYVDNDKKTTIGDNFDGEYYRLNGLTIKLSDGSSTVDLDVTQGTPQTFTDTNGTDWSVTLDGAGYLTGDPTNIVSNTDSVPDGDGPDYHFTLTFVPEPSSTAFLGALLSLGLLRRRRS